jgi:carboxylesterase
MATSIMPGCEPFSAPGDGAAVLVLHGFTGNPQSLRALAELIAAHGYRVELPRLPGHGTSLEDMMTTTWADWSAAALAAYDALAALGAPVAVLGLSMGGGLAAWIAERREDVAALVLINPMVQPPLREIADGLAQLLNAGVETIDSIGSDIRKEGSREFSYPATPLACAQSLFDAMLEVREGLGRIGAPILLLSSREDHVVASDNGDAVVQHAAGPVERIWLEDSYHVATLDNDAPLIEAATVAFLARTLHP